jgi:hypothetical protein
MLGAAQHPNRRLHFLSVEMRRVSALGENMEIASGWQIFMDLLSVSDLLPVVGKQLSGSEILDCGKAEDESRHT